MREMQPFAGAVRTPLGMMVIDRITLKGGAFNFTVSGTATEYAVLGQTMDVELFGVDETLVWKGPAQFSWSATYVAPDDTVTVEFWITPSDMDMRL